MAAAVVFRRPFFSQTHHFVQHFARIADAFRPVGTRAGQCFVEGVENELMYGLAVAETDFGFGGMDVHVHGFGRQFEKEDEGGREGLVEHVAVGLLDGVQHDFVAHEAAVNEAILLAGFAFGEGGFGNQAIESHTAAPAFHGQ